MSYNFIVAAKNGISRKKGVPSCLSATLHATMREQLAADLSLKLMLFHESCSSRARCHPQLLNLQRSSCRTTLNLPLLNVSAHLLGFVAKVFIS